MLWGLTLSDPVHAVVRIHSEHSVNLQWRNGLLSGSDAGGGAGPEVRGLKVAVGGVRRCHSVGVRQQQDGAVVKSQGTQYQATVWCVGRARQPMHSMEPGFEDDGGTAMGTPPTVGRSAWRWEDRCFDAKTIAVGSSVHSSPYVVGG